MSTPIDSVRDRLNESLFHPDVTAGDLKDITGTLNGLPEAERNGLVSSLSDQELAHWGSEANSWVNGLSASDRGALMNTLASSLDGTQLARVGKAFGLDQVGTAVVAQSDPQQKAGFVQALSGQVQGGVQDRSAGLGTLTSTYGNQPAHVAADVLASLANSPAQFAQSVRQLDAAGKLDAVLQAAANRSDTAVVSGSLAPPTTLSEFKPDTLNAIIGAASRGDLELRTTVFESAVPQLAAMQQASTANPGGDSVAAGQAQRTATALHGLLSRAEATAAGIGVVPDHPASASLRDNIATSQQHTAFPTNLPWFYEQVKGKGPWDYKQQGQPGQYESFGNFNYGVTAAAANIPEDVALRAAGWAQTQAGTSRDEWGSPIGIGGSYGDDPRDQAQIQAGYDHFNSGLWRVWSN